MHYDLEAASLGVVEVPYQPLPGVKVHTAGSAEAIPREEPRRPVYPMSAPPMMGPRRYGCEGGTAIVAQVQ